MAIAWTDLDEDYLVDLGLGMYAAEVAPSVHSQSIIWTPFPQQQVALVSQAQRIFYGGSAGGGKATTVDTEIPTPEGYKLMGDLQVGDLVYGQDGKPYPVLAISPVMVNRDCYKLTFCDGATIVVDGEHQWLTSTERERNTKKASVKTTKQILETLTARDRTNHSIPICKPLEKPNVALPIHPYVLGFWLGDGNSFGCGLTIGDEYAKESLETIAGLGYVTSQRSEPMAYGVLGLTKPLRLLGLLGDKHIPEVYMNASVDQRIELLQGLMDTDGTACKSGSVEFYSSLKTLVYQVSQLLYGLGIKHTVKPKKAPPGTPYGISYRIKFVAPFPVFKLPTKLARQNLKLRATQYRRYILKVEKVDSVPVKCIQVDSPGNLYLATKACIVTHNSDLLVAMALLYHHRSIIFRREYPQLKAIVQRSTELIGELGRFNSSQMIWNGLPGGKVLEFGAVQHEKDKIRYQGRPHDFKGFDEITHFTRDIFEFLTGWTRTTLVDQETKIVCTGNPPTNAEGQWVKRYWAPWIDKRHPNPAEPAELRWFVVIKGEDHEVDNGDPFEHDGEILEPHSRTFIPAKLADNPALAKSGYRAVLQGLPEPLRSQMLYGSFDIDPDDDVWQVIPSEWLRLAVQRWNAINDLSEWHKPPLSQIGVDVARGGKDKTVIARRYGNYFAKLIRHPGKATPDGESVGKLVLPHLESPITPVAIDIIGVGGSPYDWLKANRVNINAFNASRASRATDKTKKLKMVNKRAEVFWLLREALDPLSGRQIAIPDDSELIEDLTAARWMLTARGIQVESKEDIAKRIGRSPDAGDALLISTAKLGVRIETSGSYTQ